MTVIPKKAMVVLRRLAKAPEFCMKLTKAHAAGAQQLKDLGLADFINLSQGGAEVSLTEQGVKEAEARQLGME